MLGKLFGKKKEPKQLEAKVSDMEFLGDLEGNGVSALRFEVGKILRKFPQVKNAYFSKLKYKTEEKYRIALVIDASEASNELGRELAEQCAGISPMDVMFTNSCSKTLLSDIAAKSEPLFSDTNLLFECPIVVSRGTNQEMPQEWKGAILCYYVAAPDYESALLRVVDDLKSDGYKYENVHDGKVSQLDPAVWWEKYIMEKWSAYSNHFPSQEDIQVLVATGGIHKGPTLGWENDAANT
ncbi:hypothetical protein EOE67_17340 [Rheinheimera riviphila]|uniref:Uncharacterized protein n=1 Tax=Rheinheimera riviphila TaxID=1834037 RepID=A0A437QFM0_9GAMM|nr:enhanced serine sensitivity protein SseB C-terminal domain-containing protein [Rheinheimera riviphila]RVU33358.1 hypothetical protein EOE67_17340 [Rheinheimera riviphila]